jgi:asparagine synthase (glutamine-hydrolysing)
VRREFVDRHQLEARQAQAEALLAAGGGRADAETRGSLANPIVPRVLTGFSALALAHSTEVRAPLLDRRVVELALRRPRWERASGGAVKHLLRRAARGLLPESVTAPRQGAKTGVLSSYFAGGFRSDPGGVVTRTLENSVLEELGLVDAATLQQAWHAYKNGGGGGGELFLAFQVELWLRARLTRSSAAIDAAYR